MIPVRLLIAGPLSMVEISNSPRLVETSLSEYILVDSCILVGHSLINPVLNIIGLSADGIREYLIGFMDFLEHFRVS